MHKHALAITALTLLLTGQAFAATCPSATKITQKPDGQGYSYSAEGGWAGDNPMADEKDLKTFKFVGAKLTDKSVICRYEADGEGGASLSVASVKQADGSAWKGGECVASDVGACAFK